MSTSLVALTGSVNRAYTLSILAGTRIPQTAYRVAKLGNLSPPNVYVELRRLAKAGIVASRRGRWVLVDERVRALFVGSGPLYDRRIRLEAKRSWYKQNRGEIQRIRSELCPERAVAAAREPRIMKEFSRSRNKNKVLRAAGLRESRHRPR